MNYPFKPPPIPDGHAWWIFDQLDEWNGTVEIQGGEAELDADAHQQDESHPSREACGCRTSITSDSFELVPSETYTLTFSSRNRSDYLEDNMVSVTVPGTITHINGETVSSLNDLIAENANQSKWENIYSCLRIGGNSVTYSAGGTQYREEVGEDEYVTHTASEGNYKVSSITFVAPSTNASIFIGNVTFSDASADDVIPSFGPYIDDVSLPAKYVIADIDVDSDNDGSIDSFDLGIDNATQSQSVKIIAVGYGQYQPIELSTRISSNVDLSKLTFELDYDKSKILLYDSASGAQVSEDGNIDISQCYIAPNTILPTEVISINGTTTIYVDGFVLGETNVTLKAYYQSDPNDSTTRTEVASDTIKLTVGFDLDTDSNNDDMIQSTPNFTLTADNHLLVDSIEDMIEATSNYGKRLIVDNTVATKVVIDTTGLSLLQDLELQVVVSAGLSLWANEAKTTRPSNFESISPFEDDTLNEIYTWIGQIPDTIVIYVEASSGTEYDYMNESENIFLVEGTGIEERAVFLRLVTSTETVLVEDTINFLCENQNVIFCGIDGTSTQDWLTGPNAHTENGRWTSHAMNFYRDINAKYRGYFYGPEEYIDGGDSDDIHNVALEWITDIYNESPTNNSPKIVLVGWSRGAMISLWVANDLSDANIPVEVVGLYDPVDMAMSIPDEEHVIASNIRNVVILGPVENSSNTSSIYNPDWPEFVRMSMKGRLVAENLNTSVIRLNLNASHGAIGGAPGYNDDSEDESYSYSIDCVESYCADLRVRTTCVNAGIYIRILQFEEYGFPENNPEAI